MFANPVLGRKSLENTGQKGAKLTACLCCPHVSGLPYTHLLRTTQSLSFELPQRVRYLTGCKKLYSLITIDNQED